MKYPQEVLEEIRQGNDIVDVVSSYMALKPRGGGFVGLCPFHSEKTPSFTVSPDRQKYHCFGCQADGNVYTFVMQKEGINFYDAIIFLAERINYRLPESVSCDDGGASAKLKETLYEIHICAARYFYGRLQESDGSAAAEYLDKRGVSQNMRTKFGLGYGGSKWDGLYQHLLREGYNIDAILNSGLIVPGKNNNYFDRFHGRLMFPIFDAFGKIVGFGGRLLEEANAAKYVNSPDTKIFNKSRNLYGINFARKTREKTLILVEGYMDTIAMHQAGFGQSVAALGTAFNKEHVSTIKRYANQAVLLFDSDEAGVNAALKAIQVCGEGELKVKVLSLSGAKDPDEFIQKFGADALKKQLAGAKSHIAFQTEQLKQKYNLDNADEKSMFTMEVSKALSTLDNGIEREAYAQEVSKLTEISQSAILTEVNKISAVKTGAYKNPFQNTRVSAQFSSKDDGTAKAKKSVLCLCAGDAKIRETVRQYLEPAEMDDSVYERMLGIIYETRQTLEPASFPNYFETVEEHKKVMEVFNVDVSIHTDGTLDKALTGSIKNIKKSYLKKQQLIFLEANDDNMVKALEISLKNLEKLYIKTVDG